MHAAVNFDRLLQFTVSAAAETATVMVAGFLDFFRSTSSMVLAAASNVGFTGFSPDSSNGEVMEATVGGAAEVFDCCASCGLSTGRRFAGLEMVEYCSESCQSSHWNFERETKCACTKSPYALMGRKLSLLSAVGSSRINELSDEILFPYEEFIELFNWEKPGYPPRGLINGGNSCFANVVLQCLTYTRPLAAYFFEKSHKLECWMDKWCFLCDFQTHVERASWSHTAFIPINILSRLPSIGGNLVHGEQEDAHEFMRFAIDKMQSVFLNEFGGEKAAHPRFQETSFVQHIFGGCLQSQVICSKCNNVSNQFDHIMDLTVEIHGNAESLEECLDQFTAEEWLHGDNMYKCDHCNAYVIARKCLAIQQAPNILTIALKRFQSGRFNKLNKRVTFPETLDLRSYMNELEDGNDVYKLYAVIVHAEILHAFGHYICYVKDFGGNWYRIDDDKVSTVGLDEVLSQGAYMLLYSRICARPSCLLPAALLKERENKKVKIQTVDPSTTQPVNSAQMSPAKHSEVEADGRLGLSFVKSAEDAVENMEMEPRTAENCTFEEDTKYDSSSFTTGEVQKDNSAKCTYMHTTAKCEGNSYEAILNPSSAPHFLGRRRRETLTKQENKPLSEVYSSASLDDDAKEAAGKISVGLSCDVKLKPLSALGGKRRKELFKQENGALVGKTPRFHLNPRFLSENGKCLKYD